MSATKGSYPGAVGLCSARRTALACALCLFGAANAAAVDVQLRPLIRAGQPVPGSPGVTFRAGSLGAYALSANGYFAAHVATSSDAALIAGDARAADPRIRVLCRNGAAAPGLPGYHVSGMSSRVGVDRFGRAVWDVLVATASAPFVTHSVYYGEFAIGSPFIIARVGEPASGVPGLTYGDLGSLEFSLWSGSGGEFAFAAGLSGTPGAESAVWRGSLDQPGALMLLARQGQAVPGQPAGVMYGDLRFVTPQVGPGGEVLISAPLVTPTQSRWALLHFPPLSDVPSVVMQQGVPLAGYTPSADNALSLVLAESGLVAVSFPVTGVGQRALAVLDPDDPGSARVVAASGQMAPGLEPRTFRSPGDWLCPGSDGRLTLVGQIVGENIVLFQNDGVLYTEQPSGLLPVARTGVQDPRLPAGQYFGSFGPFGRDRLGLSVARTYIQGTGITGSNDHGLIALDAAGNLHIIAREGDTVSVAGDGSPSLAYLNSSYATMTPGINASGEFLLSAGFTNASGVLLFGQIIACAGDFNHDGSGSVQDVFDFLAAWFAGLPAADISGDGSMNVQDVFDFLAAWFEGCD